MTQIAAMCRTHYPEAQPHQHLQPYRHSPTSIADIYNVRRLINAYYTLTDLCSSERRRWQSDLVERRTRPSLRPRESLHPSHLVMEKRATAECPSQDRGTSCDHTNQEFERRVCTTDSGTALGPRNHLSDSNGSDVAARGACSHPGV